MGLFIVGNRFRACFDWDDLYAPSAACLLFDYNHVSDAAVYRLSIFALGVSLALLAEDRAMKPRIFTP